SPKMFFGSTVISNKGFFDIFLAKYNSQGDLVWVRSAGWSGADSDYGIAYANGGIYITGFFNQGMIFGSYTLWSHEGKGGEDGFIAKYNEHGLFQWAKNAGGLGGDRLFGVAMDPDGFPVVVGRVNSLTAPFGNTSVSGPNAPFIAKLGLFPENLLEIENEEFRIYPNPTTGTLQISTDKRSMIKQASIRDMRGRVVREYAPLPGNGLLDVSELPEGMYLLYLD